MISCPPPGTIRFAHVSKRYLLGSFAALRSLFQGRLSGHRQGRQVFWALRDVSFDLEPGESLGIIGPNGAGKTTALKLLSRITRPSEGSVEVAGRTACLIQLGAGFHPELTGRENVYLNAAILGLNRREVDERLSDIVDFSGLKRFIDTPVKRYSSGMYVRLGFAVAAHVEPQVLLVDEVLSVGDASFRRKCLDKMRELAKNGTTRVFVSHNLHLVRETCDHVLLLVDGQIRAQGDPDSVIAEYERVTLHEELGAARDAQSPAVEGVGASQALIHAVTVGTPLGLQQQLASHLAAVVRVEIIASPGLQTGKVNIRMIRDDGLVCCSVASRRGSHLRGFRVGPAGESLVEATFQPLQLASGRYRAMVRITDPTDAMVIASGQSDWFTVHAQGTRPGDGTFVPCVSWRARGCDG